MRVSQPATRLVCRGTPSALAMAQAPRTQPPTGLVDHHLDNGARIIVLPTQAGGDLAPVAIQLWVMAGTAAERPSEHGSAHLLEHMLFKPTTVAGTRGRVDIAGAIEGVGGDVNAFTSHDETVFHATVPVRELELGLQGLVAPVLCPSLEDEELAREAQVVVEEIRQCRDDPAQRVGQELMSAVFPGHAYGRSVLGTEREVLSHDIRSLRAFHRRAYAGPRLALVVVGPVEPSRVVRRASRLLGSSPATGRIAPVGKPSPRPRPRVRVRQDDIHEAHVMMGWQGPPFGDPGSCALEVAAVVLGHGDASRLAAHTRRRDHLVSDVHATCYTSRKASTFILAAHTTGALAGRAAEAMLAEIERMTLVAIDAEEMARARAVLESDLVYRRETVQGQAHAVGYSLSVNGDLEGDRVYYENLARLTPRDVQHACEAYLDAGRAVVSMAVPRRRRGDAQARGLRVRVARRLKAQVSRAALAAKQRPKGDRNGIWTVDLDSGVRVRLHVNREVPMAAGWLVWPGGMRLERAREAGASALLARLLTRGTEERSGNSLAREIDGMAAVLEGFSGRNSLGLHFESLAADLPTVLSRAFECSLGATFPQNEIDEERRVAIRELEALEDDLGQVALKEAMKELYGAHPLSRPRHGLRSSLARMTRKYLRRLWRLSYPIGRATLSVAGDLNVDEVVSVVRSLVPAQSGRPPARLPRWPGPAPSAIEGPTECFVRRSREQAHLVVAYQGIPLGDRRNPCLDVLMMVLGGQSGRLFGALRESEGLVYDVSASSVCAIDAGHVVVHASTSQEKLPRARAAVRAELSRVTQELVQGEELDRVKACLVGQHETGLQRRGRVASHLAFNEAYGLGYSAHLRYIREVERVSPRQVRNLARCLLDTGREVVAVVAARQPRSG